MEELQKKHRREQKDLQLRITQKKNSATKKTRKGVNDECAELERQLQEKHQSELSGSSGVPGTNEITDKSVENGDPEEQDPKETPEDINESPNSLSMTSPTPSSNGQTKKPNRQKARLARRAAEQEAAAEQAQREAANLPNLRDQERNSMCEAYRSKGLKEQEIRSDGHCLYAAVADQLLDQKLALQRDADIQSKAPKPEGYKVTRQVAATYISEHPDDFVPFLEEPLDQYVKTIRETGEWGGHLELLALAKAYAVDVNVLQGDGKVEKIECGLDDDHPALWLGYYRHSFGLGEHYNSLRQVD